MSDTEHEAAPPYRPPRRFRRLIGIAAIVGVLALFAALTLWAARPRWRTFVSKPTAAAPHVALVLRVPVGWECVQVQNPDAYSFISVAIRRKPLTGFPQWWNQYVLGKTQQLPHQEYGFITLGTTYYPGDPGQEILSLKQWYQQWRATMGYRNTVRIFEHPLGTAIDAISSPPSIGISATRASKGMAFDAISATRDSNWYESLDIVMGRSKKYTNVRLHLRRSGPAADSSQTQSTWNEIVRSVRVVQK